ncbi:MAG TPA: hypothetical protein V6C84_08965 [Coleofasciculaceae cyanobacterium]
MANRPGKSTRQRAEGSALIFKIRLIIKSYRQMALSSGRSFHALSIGFMMMNLRIVHSDRLI